MDFILMYILIFIIQIESNVYRYISNSCEFEERRNESELNKISISNFIQQSWSLKFCF